MDILKNIQEICELPNGVDLMGVTPVERFNDLPEDYQPTAFLPSAKSVVVLGSQVFKVLTRKLTAHRKFGEVSFRDFYDAHNEAVVHDLTQTSYRVARYLTNQGHASVNVGQDLTDYRTIQGSFSFTHAAIQAGMGVLGKNGLLITPQYGPRIKLSAVLTEAPLKANDLMNNDVCGDCDICIKVCPSGALKTPVQDRTPNFDRFVCNSFYTANGGCGMCLAKCPR